MTLAAFSAPACLGSRCARWSHAVTRAWKLGAARYVAWMPLAGSSDDSSASPYGIDRVVYGCKTLCWGIGMHMD